MKTTVTKCNVHKYLSTSALHVVVQFRGVCQYVAGSQNLNCVPFCSFVKRTGIDVGETYWSPGIGGALLRSFGNQAG